MTPGFQTTSARAAVRLVVLPATLLFALLGWRWFLLPHGATITWTMWQTSQFRSLRTISWDEAGTRLHPWPEDPECSGLEVSFARNSSLPLTALASYPGSGN